MRTRADLIACIEADASLRELRDHVEERLSADADGEPDPGHDIDHALRVALFTLRLAGASVDPREAIAAALLHDVVNVPKSSPERARASELSARVARELLPGVGFDEPAVESVATAIRDHSYSRGAEPATPLGAALQDADRLEALGAVGILRTASCGARMGASFFDADDPWARSRELDDARFTVDHFFRKLLGLTETMRTEAGREEARRRVRIMEAFLDALAEEIGSPRP